MRHALRLSHKLPWLFFFFSAVALLSLVPVSVAHADNRDPYNSAEADAKSLCGSDRRGAIWFTSSGDYYTDSVSIAGDQNEVDVYIRGSVYSCKQSGTAHTGAVNVSPQGANGWRLTSLGSTTLDRGTVSGKRNWSSQGGQISAKLNVTGLATNNNGRSDSQTITIDLYRCFYNYTSGEQGSCYAQTISVTVTRAPKPDPASVYNFESANCSTAWGWFFDPSRPNDSIKAHIIVDNDLYRPLGGPTNIYRRDVNAVPPGRVGNHGFDNDISARVSGSGSHNVKVYTYNVNSAGAETGGPLLFGEKTVSGCLDYSLTPSINITSSKVVEADSAITMQPRIDNSGPTDSGSTTQWKLTSFRVAPGSAIPQLDKIPTTEYNSDQADPCRFYEGSGVSGCGPAVFTSQNNTASNTGLNVPVPYKLFEQRTAVAGDFVPGTKICYALSAWRRADDSAQWVYSNPACVTVGKSPKVQIWGGDLGVGVIFAGSAVSSNANTGVVTKNGTTFGSWVEYGIFATGLVTGTGSGSAYAGAGLANAGRCNTSYLSFTNSGNNTCYSLTNIGNYANSSSIPDVAASFPVVASTPVFGPNDLSVQSQNGVFRVNGTTIFLSGGNIQKGRWVVINAPAATVTITGDIKYTEGQLLSVGDIPQVIIIANKIIIDGNVTRVDAWLIASGTNGIIETCNVNSSNYILTGTDRLTANKCNSPLVVNGPVMAKQLWLRRTGGSGSGPASGDPAEVFNLRPDAYMWANLHSAGNNRVQTVYSTELPPRL